MANEITDVRLEGATKVSSAEAREHEGAIFAKRVTEIPSNLQMRVEYTSGQPLYTGYAPKGVASSTGGWLLQKFTYSSGQVTLRQIAYDSWDNRATASYS